MHSSAHAHAPAPSPATAPAAAAPNGATASRPAPPRSFVQPAERTRTGRPTLQTPEIVQCILAQIRTYGISDSAAGLLAGISTTTVSRWKQEDETFATLLGQARAQYDVARLSAIRGAQKRDGSVDWRAQAWLLQNSSPEEYGRPSRRSKYRRPPMSQALVEITADDVTIITEAELELIRSARAAADVNNEKRPIIPETPVPVSEAEAASRHTLEQLAENVKAADGQEDTEAQAMRTAAPRKHMLPLLPETPRPLTGLFAPTVLRLHCEQDDPQSDISSRNSSRAA